MTHSRGGRAWEVNVSYVQPSDGGRKRTSSRAAAEERRRNGAPGRKFGTRWAGAGKLRPCPHHSFSWTEWSPSCSLSGQLCYPCADNDCCQACACVLPSSSSRQFRPADHGFDMMGLFQRQQHPFAAPPCAPDRGRPQPSPTRLSRLSRRRCRR